MHRIKLKLRHVAGAASLACAVAVAALSFTSLPVGAQQAVPAAPSPSCPVLSLGNPNPGNTVQVGGLVISGQAYDPAATQGSGVSRVDLFLGERDLGGIFLGSAIPGTTASGNPRDFSVEVTIPSGINHGLDFAAYAVSSVTGQETSVTFPIFVGVPPTRSVGATPTPIPTTQTVANTCRA
jgi:hypothetical protein